MRINFRLKLFGYTIFFMISKTQKLEGISSKLKNGKHIILLDVENTTLDKCKENIKFLQCIYNLSNIYITSDIENSFRIWCFTQLEWKDYLGLLLKVDNLDYNFFYWTVQRGKATLRISNKLDREPQKIIQVLETTYEKPPKELESVIYDTGYDKRMINIMMR